MIIKLGPAGSPAASTLEGIKVVSDLGLQVMEVEFVRGVRMSNELAKQVGQEAKKYNISLSTHAPYYINLASEEKKKILESKQRILDSCERSHHMGSKHVVFHPAYFGKLSKEECFQITKEQILDMLDTIKKSKWNVLLSPETTGKHSALGSLDETIRLAQETKCSICLDPAHLFARNNGKIDFAEVFDKLEQLKLKHLHCHFSGITYTSKGERAHSILDHSPNFKEFAKEILKRKIDCTIICESPITWRDSLKMKKIFEQLGHKF